MIAYEEGYEAFKNKLSIEDNPYLEYSTEPEFEEWDEGFLDAAKEKDADREMIGNDVDFGLGNIGNK